MATAYGPARTTQLRALLWVALVLAVLMVALSGAAVASGSVRWGLAVGVVALAGGVVAAVGVRDRSNARLRTLSLLSGGCQALVGVLLAASVLGILPSIVGILQVLVALLPGAAGDSAD
jgi:hypothetical protein